MPELKTYLKMAALAILPLLALAGCGNDTARSNHGPPPAAENMEADPYPSTAAAAAGNVTKSAPPGRRPGARPKPGMPPDSSSETAGDEGQRPGGQPPEDTGTPAGAGEKEEAEEDEGEETPDLIIEAGFDMIYPNFNKETGRRDPFVPVSPMEADWKPLKDIAGEKFRVIGTAMTPSGQIAMITVMEQTKIIREGDVLENGSVVKSISPYDVVLQRDEREMRLTMFTRKRVARQEAGEEQLKIRELDNINDLYKKYLEEKFGEEVEGEEGESHRPGTFNDYLEYRGPRGGRTSPGGEN